MVLGSTPEAEEVTARIQEGSMREQEQQNEVLLVYGPNIGG